MDTIIKNGKLVIPRIGVVDGDLAIDNGKIAAILQPGTPCEANEVIDASGKYVFPGMIDPHVHWGCYQDMGKDTREESAAAAIGGYTTVLQYRRTPGPTFAPEYVNQLLDTMTPNTYIDYGLQLFITKQDHKNTIPQAVEEMGVSSFKLFTTERNVDVDIRGLRDSGIPEPYTDGFMYESMKALAKYDGNVVANFHPENTHLSECPDTLHLPGHDKGKSYKDEVIIPLYYKEHFFANDSLLREEVGGGRYGVAGDPKPYTSRNDDVITSLLLICFVITLLAFSRSMSFIARQAKDFFYVHHNEDSQIMTETTGEFRFQFFLVVQTCLLLALLVFFYTLENVANTFILQSQYQLVAIFTGCFIAYYLLKALLYEMVNMVFFDKKKMSCGLSRNCSPYP